MRHQRLRTWSKIFLLILAATPCLSAGSNPDPGEDPLFEGRFIIEGDILRRLVPLTATKAEVTSSRSWAGGIIPYVIDASVRSASFRTRIEQAMRQWEVGTPVRFVPREGQVNYVRIVQFPNMPFTGFAELGMVGGEQFLYLRDQNVPSADIVHELGHTLGFEHEHQRADRDQFITVLWQNLRFENRGSYAIKTWYVQETAYDFASIMHYQEYVFSRNGSPVHLPKPQYSDFRDLGGRTISPTDREDVNRLYADLPSGEPIHIPDPTLKSLLVKGFDLNGDGEVDREEAKAAYVLDLEENGIRDITGLEYFVNIWRLNLDKNQIRDLSPLSGHPSLYSLVIWDNRIDSLEPLAHLPNLTQLWAIYNDIEDLTPLASLPQLELIDLSNNRIADLSPLAGLNNLLWLRISGNRVSDLSPLRSLPNLRRLHAANNRIEDLAPLVENDAFGLNAGLPSLLGTIPDDLILVGNALDDGDCADLAELAARHMSSLQASEQSRVLLTCPDEGKERWLPHIARRLGGFSTRILLYNTAAKAETITLTPYNNNGVRLDALIETLLPGETRLIRTASLLPFPSHFQITGSDAVTATVVYRADNTTGTSAHVRETTNVRHDFVIQPADWDLAFDGMAAVNVGRLPSEIFAEMYDAQGDRLAVARISGNLAPGAKTLAVFDDLFEAPAGRIEIHSTEPLVMVLLRGLDSGAGPSLLWQTAEDKPLPGSGERFLAHVTAPAGGFETQLTIANTLQFEGRVTLQPFTRTGVALVPLAVTLPGKESLTAVASDLLGPEVSHFSISGDTHILVHASYRAAGESPAARAGTIESWMFGRTFTVYPGEWPLVWDGAALVNMGSQAANIEAVRLNERGEETARVNIENALAPNAKALAVLSEIFAEAPDMPIVIQSDQPLAAIFLRGSKQASPGYLYETRPSAVLP